MEDFEEHEDRILKDEVIQVSKDDFLTSVSEFQASVEKLAGKKILSGEIKQKVQELLLACEKSKKSMYSSINYFSNN